ncbi:hypothetical protein G6F65_020822 [Rhizopus arrhizus]|nr:hypothetical protein G6F65_020822 [Rhizopus arrhizus]
MQCAVQRRAGSKREQRLRVRGPPLHHPFPAGVGKDGIAVDIGGERAESRTQGRGQWRVGRRHRHGVRVLRQDGAARQHFQLAVRRRRQQQHGVGLVRGIVGEHDAAVGRHGAQDRRIDVVAASRRADMRCRPPKTD